MNIFIGHNVIGSDVAALDKSLRDPGSRFHEVSEIYEVNSLFMFYTCMCMCLYLI